jgi:hypothetical protein
MAAPQTVAPNPDNRSTPDEPKSCSPTPRHALKHYPTKKHSTG